MPTRARLELRIRYSTPIEAASRALRVLPASRASQSVTSEQWTCEPPPTHSETKCDRWGNRVLWLRHRRLERELHFTLQFEAQTKNEPIPGPIIGTWKMPSRAVPFATELAPLSQGHRDKSPLERATYWNQFVYENLRYEEEASERPLDCGAIWARKYGSCADFTHVFLALCRQSGLPARYIAGFNPAAGLLHAWGEVWVAGSWHGFDPTHGRAPSPGCVVVAQGRDFYDCPPHRGHYRGGAEAHLEMCCLTQITGNATTASDTTAA